MDYQFGEYRLKAHERQVVGPNGDIGLTARSFDILQVLLAHPSELVTKSALLEAVWPHAVVEENALQVHVSALRKAFGPSLIATVHGRGYRYAGPPPRGIEQGMVAKVERAAAAKPVIVVLPFEDLSGNADQRFFSDGISDDITDRLTRFRGLAVIGHHSALAFRGTTPDFIGIRERLRADFVVTGSIRRSGERVRVAVRLSELANETAIWAEHYDRPLVDLFDVQDEVANLVAAATAGHLEMEIVGRIARKPPANLTGYEYLLQGQWHFNKCTRPGNEEALSYFKLAVDLDPHNAEALSWLALGHINRWCTDFSDHDVRTGVALALQAIQRAPSSARCHLSCGFGQLWTHGLETACKSVERSIALNPGDANTFANRALVSVYEGELSEALGWLARAHALNPIPPVWYAQFRSLIAFAAGEYAETLPGVEAIAGHAWDMMYALSCYGHLKLEDKARGCLEGLKAEGRDLDFLAAAAREPFAYPEPRERLVKGLELALSF